MNDNFFLIHFECYFFRMTYPINSGAPLQESLAEPMREIFKGLRGHRIIDIRWHEQAELNDPLVEFTALQLAPGLYECVNTLVMKPASHEYRLNLKEEGTTNEYDLEYAVAIEESIGSNCNRIGELAEEMSEDDISRNLQMLCIEEAMFQVALHKAAIDSERAGVPVHGLMFDKNPSKLDIGHIHIDEWLLKRKFADGGWRKGLYVSELLIEAILSEPRRIKPAGIRNYVSTSEEEYICFVNSYNGLTFFGCQEDLNGYGGFDGSQIRLYDAQGLVDFPEATKLAYRGKPLGSLMETGDADLDSRKIIGIEDFDERDEDSELIVTVEPKLVRIGSLA